MYFSMNANVLCFAVIIVYSFAFLCESYHKEAAQNLRLRGCGVRISTWLLHPSLVLNESQKEINRRLLEASERGDCDGINKSLQIGAEVNAAGPGLWTPLHFAARYGHPEAIKLLIKSGANLESRRSQDTLSQSSHFFA